jgi:hypothetical protein
MQALEAIKSSVQSATIALALPPFGLALKFVFLLNYKNATVKYEGSSKSSEIQTSFLAGQSKGTLTFRCFIVNSFRSLKEAVVLVYRPVAPSLPQTVATLLIIILVRHDKDWKRKMVRQILIDK